MQARMTGILLGALALLSGACSFAQNDTQSLTMDEAVRTALSGNLTLQAARADATSARARITAARSAEYPAIGLSAVYSHTSDILIPGIPVIFPKGLDMPPRNSVSALVVARLSLYTGGRQQATISRAEALSDAAVARLSAAENQVAFHTRQAYSASLLSESLVTAGRKVLDAARGQNELAESRYKAGTAARFDVLRAQTQVSEAEQNLLQATNQVDTARMALNRLLGTPLEKRYKLAKPVIPDVNSEDVNALVKLADGQRPEILAAAAQLAAAKTGIRLAKSQTLPQLEVISGYQVFEHNAPVDVKGATLAALLTVPIWSGGKARADAKDAESLVDAAQANLADTRLMVEQEVRQSWLDMQTARTVRTTAESRLALADEAHQIATVRYKAGLSTAVEVADAIAALTAAQTNMEKAASGCDIAYAALQRSLGRSVY